MTEEIVQPLPGMGHEALLVRGDVAADRWQAICQIVRKKFSYPQFPLYEKGE